MTRVQTAGLLASLLLAACGGASAPASSAPAAKPSAPGSTPAAATPASAKPAPASSVAPPSAEARGAIKVGVVLTLTGPQSSVGKDNEDGLKLYLRSVHNTVAGRTIQPIFVDDQFKADAALTKAKELVENEHVALLMGFIATPAGYVVAQWVKQSAHVPMLITSNSGGEGMLTNPQFQSPYLTRWTQDGAEIVDVAADWATKQGYRKAVMVNSDYAPGIQNADLFGSTFIRRGGAIVQEEYPTLGSTDFGPHLAQLNKTADVIFTFLPGADGLRFAEQYRSYVAHRMAPDGRVLWRFAPTGHDRLNHPSIALPLALNRVAICDDGADQVLVVDPTINAVVWRFWGQGGLHLRQPDGLAFRPA